MLVRGGDLDPDILSGDAVRYHSIYGVYGISVFAVLLGSVAKNSHLIGRALA